MARKGSTLFRLWFDKASTVRRVGIARLSKAVTYLDRVYGRGRYSIITKEPL